MSKTELMSNNQLARERSLESWLVGQVATAFDALKTETQHRARVGQAVGGAPKGAGGN
jgi:hypothetical protein